MKKSNWNDWIFIYFLWKKFSNKKLNIKKNINELNSIGVNQIKVSLCSHLFWLEDSLARLPSALNSPHPNRPNALSRSRWETNTFGTEASFCRTPHTHASTAYSWPLGSHCIRSSSDRPLAYSCTRPSAACIGAGSCFFRAHGLSSGNVRTPADTLTLWNSCWQSSTSSRHLRRPIQSRNSNSRSLIPFVAASKRSRLQMGKKFLWGIEIKFVRKKFS